MRRNKITYDPFNDYYVIIGVESTATDSEIQQAYRQRAKQLHPDLNPERVEWATQQFQLLNEAYAVLSDLEQRREYNNVRWGNVAFVPPRPQPQSQPKADNSKVHPDPWWDQPQSKAKKSASSKTHFYPPPPSYIPRERPGAWLDQMNLGFVRPFYAATVDLIRSPYRYILILLGIVMLVQLMIIMATLASSEGDEPLEPTPAVSPTPVFSYDDNDDKFAFTLPAVE